MCAVLKADEEVSLIQNRAWKEKAWPFVLYELIDLGLTQAFFVHTWLTSSLLDYAFVWMTHFGNADCSMGKFKLLYDFVAAAGSNLGNCASERSLGT